MPFHLGDTFPNFDADAFGVDGKFNLYNYLGDKSWGIFFSHPADFTPVCTSELGQAIRHADEFKRLNCKLVAFSCQDVKSHEMWAKDIMACACSKCGCGSGKSCGSCDGKLPFPIVCDPDRSLAKRLNIMDPKEKDSSGLPLTCRSVFFLSPDKKVASLILYPATVGRSFKEILRALEALQVTAEYNLATPVEWTPGGKCFIPIDVSDEEAKKKFPKGVEKKELPSGKGYLRCTPDPR